MATEERPRVRVLHPVSGESRTKQSDALQTDINSIMGKYVRTGYLPLPGGQVPQYGDFSSGLDYHAAANRVAAIKYEYLRLPLRVREATGNDPGRFVDMLMSPEGRAELEKLGMPEEAVPERAPDPKPAAPPADTPPTE